MSPDYHCDHQAHPGYYMAHPSDYSDPSLHIGDCDYPDHPDPPNYHPCHLGDYFDHPGDYPNHTYKYKKNVL